MQGSAAPAYMTSPLAMRRKASNISVMSLLGWWMVSATVRPCAASVRSVRMIVTAICTATPLLPYSSRSPQQTRMRDHRR